MLTSGWRDEDEDEDEDEDDDGRGGGGAAAASHPNTVLSAFTWLRYGDRTPTSLFTLTPHLRSISTKWRTADSSRILTRFPLDAPPPVTCPLSRPPSLLLLLLLEASAMGSVSRKTTGWVGARATATQGRQVRWSRGERSGSVRTARSTSGDPHESRWP